MSFAIALTDEPWELVVEPPGRRGAPAQIPRGQMVDATLLSGAPVASGATCPHMS